MGSKIVSSNLRGIKDYAKQVAVRDMIARLHCVICCIQETKMISMSQWFVRQLWYDSDFGMEVLPSQGAVGNSDGLITIWDNTTLELLDKRLGLNYITCLFRFRSTGFKFLLTNAYSPCDHDRRETFWSDLAQVRAWSSESWCFVGDVNAVRSDAERNKPGRDARNMKFLDDFISDQELIDLPLHGGAYTWINKQNDHFLCRLDRCLVYITFDAKFNNATQTALNLKYFIKNWSRSTFENVRKEEEELKKKISALNIAEESIALSSTQLGEGADLLNSLSKVKCSRAKMVFQRAKVKGFKDGDKNTQYFHKIASGKKRRNCIKKLEVDGVDVFNHEVLKKEIHEYYTSMFTAVSPVYKACWEVLKKDILASLNEFHGKGKLDWRLNVSFLKLIPKKEDSATVKDFRPLSLISRFYKILCKLLAERMKVVMPGLISNSQGAFIKDRQILDDILVANELIDSKLKQCIPGIMCKIDMQKAFDNFSILFNGEATKLIKPSKGIRQGDPLSPFLFLLVAEVLSFLINNAVAQGRLSGFRVKEGGTVVSHLQFADDTIIFLDATIVEVRRLLVILVMFEILIGLRLNLEKSTMISIGADQLVNKLAMELGCRVEFIPITYSGMSIGSKRRFEIIWEIIIQRMQKKLAPWKRRYLNKAGRVVLIRSSLESLAVYFMSLHHIPVSVEKILNTIMRKFLWGDDDERRRMSWVSFKRIFKEERRLGLEVIDSAIVAEAHGAQCVFGREGDVPNTPVMPNDSVSIGTLAHGNGEGVGVFQTISGVNEPFLEECNDRGFHSSVPTDDLQMVLHSSQLEDTVVRESPLLAHVPPTDQHLYLFNVINDQIVIKLGDIQKANIDSNEVIFSTLNLVVELCCRMGGISSKDEVKAKSVIDEILFKYGDMYKAIAEGQKVIDSCDSNVSNSSNDEE
ncbi:uncharacterized protein LOC113312278 [Papaver somniferum]|uniref:uncharacterized protein LOC113312277 n=1 Tax=Papaver somniferum TaxID=3469 RepID=UPI000E6FF771|nr:uncharacterized protein LOC113312277 [Papaver somniferum]XP_026416825.1 uncharacterized protein LOC113312278 [Papaver somniferum]